jgi:hypothetical protein
LRTETEKYFDDIERAGGKKFTLRADIGTLWETAHDAGKEQVLDDVLFLAKFISRAEAILTRPGMKQEDTAKLSVEFSGQVEKASTLLRTLVKESPEATKQHFLGRYLSLRNDNLQNLLGLFRELSWIKNFQVDASRGQ